MPVGIVDNLYSRDIVFHSKLNVRYVYTDQGLRCSPKDDLDSVVPTECSAKNDETARMHMLISVHAELTWNVIANIVPRLIYAV